MAVVNINYMSEDLYKHDARNPPDADGFYRLPDKKLRQIYKNNSANPISIASRRMASPSTSRQATLRPVYTTSMEMALEIYDRFNRIDSEYFDSININGAHRRFCKVKIFNSLLN